MVCRRKESKSTVRGESMWSLAGLCRRSAIAWTNQSQERIAHENRKFDISTVTPELLHASKSTAETTHLAWYNRWLDWRLSSMPISIVERLHSIPQAFEEVATHIKFGDNIDETATALVKSGFIRGQLCEEDLQVARCIVFAMLGWQTMLFEPSFHTCPPGQFALTDVLEGCNCQAFWTTKQDQSKSCLCLADFLLGFGLMLPKGNLCISEDVEDRNAFDDVVLVGHKSFNAALLHIVAHVKIEWVDVMALHMEYNKASNILYLFRYPSFCLANVPSQPGSKGVIHW